MKPFKECPVCGEEYTESQWRKSRGGYRAFRHFDGTAKWCKSKPGKHLARFEVKPV